MSVDKFHDMEISINYSCLWSLRGKRKIITIML